MSSITNDHPPNSSCGISSRTVNRNHKAIQCDSCVYWIHYKCNALTMNYYFLLQSSGEVWYCKNYIASIFPFSAVDDSKLLSFMNCNKRSHREFLPSLDILSSGVLHLDNSDVGNNIPSPINSPTTRPLILVRPAEILPHDETNTNELLKRVTSTTTPPNTT